METKLIAQRRDGTGKGVARRLRASGRVPAVLYGQGIDATPLTVDARELNHLLHSGAGSNVLVDLVVDDTAHLAIPREIQRDHIHARFIHVDFLAVSRTETITVNVPVVEIGEAVGIKEGGVVEHHLRELQVECLPQDVPDQIEVDISHVELGGMIHVHEVTAPSGVTILTNPEDAVLSIITPALLRVEADLTVPGEEAAAAEVPEALAEGEVPEGEAPAASAEGDEAAAPAAEEGGES